MMVDSSIWSSKFLSFVGGIDRRSLGTSQLKQVLPFLSALTMGCFCSAARQKNRLLASSLEILKTKDMTEGGIAEIVAFRSGVLIRSA